MDLALLGSGQGWCKQVGGHPTLSREQLIDDKHQREHALASCWDGEQSLFRRVWADFEVEIFRKIVECPRQYTLQYTNVHSAHS